MSRLATTLRESTLLHVGVAFLAMGGWAFYANAAHPMPEPLIAGTLQGCISAGLTLFLKRAVDWMRPKFSPALGYVVPAGIALTMSAALLLCAHTVAGTPEIFMTIALPLIVSATYIFSYNILQQRHARKDAHE